MKTLILYHAKWCPHCQNFMSTWEEIKKKLGKKIKCIAYEADENKREIEKANISGFPTLIIIDNDKKSVYDGDRTTEAIIKAVNDVAPMRGGGKEKDYKTLYLTEKKKYIDNIAWLSRG